MRLALAVATLAAVLGAVTGLAFLFAPLYDGCGAAAAGGGPGAGPECASHSLVQVQPVWPLPLLAIAIWALAPSLVLAGVLRRRAGRGSGSRAVLAGMALEATVLLSFGAATFFFPLFLVTLLATALALRITLPRRAPGAAEP